MCDTEEGELKGEVAVRVGDISDSRLCADDTVRNGYHSDPFSDSMTPLLVFLFIIYIFKTLIN